MMDLLAIATFGFKTAPSSGNLTMELSVPAAELAIPSTSMELNLDFAVAISDVSPLTSLIDRATTSMEISK